MKMILFHPLKNGHVFFKYINFVIPQGTKELTTKKTTVFISHTT